MQALLDFRDSLGILGWEALILSSVVQELREQHYNHDNWALYPSASETDLSEDDSDDDDDDNKFVLKRQSFPDSNDLTPTKILSDPPATASKERRTMAVLLVFRTSNRIYAPAFPPASSSDGIDTNAATMQAAPTASPLRYLQVLPNQDKMPVSAHSTKQDDDAVEKNESGGRQIKGMVQIAQGLFAGPDPESGEDADGAGEQDGLYICLDRSGLCGSFPCDTSMKSL
jgi:hypothetical protein